MYEHAFIFVINFFNIVIIGNVYNALMHKIEFGQSYFKDILKRTLNKFTLHFCDVYSILYELLKFHEFLENLNWKMISKMIKPRNNERVVFDLRPSSERSDQRPIRPMAGPGPQARQCQCMLACERLVVIAPRAPVVARQLSVAQAMRRD
jgi:hypothetical protein